MRRRFQWCSHQTGLLLVQIGVSRETLSESASAVIPPVEDKASPEVSPLLDNGGRGGDHPSLIERKTALGDPPPRRSAKPSFRGVLHHYGAIASIFTGIALVASCAISGEASERAILGSVVFASSMTLLLGTSASYHRLEWSPVGTLWMRRLDHSSIFILIAGTYTPFCLSALEPREGRHLLLIVWSGAAAGIVKCLFWPHAPKTLSTALYILLGWVVVPYVSEFSKGVGPFGGTLMLMGGLCYTVGGVIYATRWPDPVPEVFGYHEVFHALVIVACMCHLSAVARLVHNIRG